ncbi:MerR family transcriptional regulator [Thaumasiovibrio subtropicus]|uniref:MerR family transcriptional regulator n=1 Tax=Thaumasiovibrio subtropicus TaxID=1891207 RepID=UPI000B34C211|nr:MerR family transcriptional regulator [Thaumasiovibrio subtropicus]
MRIQEAAEKSGLSCHTLRYYEKQGLIYPIARDNSGHRVYRQQDIHWLNFVQCLKKTGMPLKHIQAYARKVATDHQDHAYLLQILNEHKMKLDAEKAAIEECLEHINWKIENYTQLI